MADTNADIIKSNGVEIATNPDSINFGTGLSATVSNGAVNVEIAENFVITNTTTDNTISVDQNGNVGTAVATDGAVHIENTGNTGIGLAVYSNMDANAASELVSIKVDNAAFDQTAVVVSNDGTGHALQIIQTGTLASGKHMLDLQMNVDNTNSGNNALYVYSDFAHTTATVGRGIAKIANDNAASVADVLYLQQDGTNGVLFIDDNGTGTKASLEIDRDGNNAARIFGMAITVDNAGAGNLVGGIDFSGMSDTEPLFKLTSTDTDLSTKNPETDTEAGWFPVLVGATVYAVPIYALS